MHIAAKRADVRMLQTLVLLGADWQVADSDGATALHYAAMGAVDKAMGSVPADMER